MFYQFRTAPTVLVAAIFLFSFLAAAGQTEIKKHRTLSGNAAERRDRTRLEARELQAQVKKTKLPFEESVIIYYKGPEKTSATSRPTVDQSRTGPDARLEEGSRSKPPETAKSLTNQAAIAPRAAGRANFAVDMQPVIIYLRTYRPAAAVGPDMKPAAVSFTKNETAPIPSPETVQKQPTRVAVPSNAFSSGSVGIAERKTEVPRSVKIETPPEDLKSNGGVTAGPKQSLSEPMSNSTPTPRKEPGDSATRQVASEPEVEASEKAAERPIALSVRERPVQKADIPSQDPGNSAAASNLNPATSSTTPQEPAQKAPPVADIPFNSVPLRTPDIPETAGGAMDAVGLNNSAVQLTIEKQYAEAQALLQRAIEAKPTEAKFHRNLSIVFEETKKFEEALASARTAAKLAPEEPSVLEQLCGIELVTGNTTASLGCYEKLRSIEPLDALSSTYYGIALFRAGKEDESVAVLEQAGQSTPPLAMTMNALGFVYFKKKRFDDAVAAFKSAVEAEPDLFEIRFNLAVAQLAVRNKAAAISQYNIIKTRDPNLAARLYRMLNSDKVLFAGDLKNPRRR